MRACVILLHGLGRGPGSMRPLIRPLQRQGFVVVNQGYPSTRMRIEDLAARYIPPAIERCQKNGAQLTHFVTHSMGAIVLRQYLQKHQLAKGARVVMLGPPNQGSEVPDRLQKRWWYRLATGPAGQQLTTDAKGLPGQLKAIDAQIGIIAGSKSLDPWFSAMIDGPDDGKVSVRSARLAEMRDFIVVHRAHTFMMRAPEVQAQVICFLQNGHFDHGGATQKQR